MWSFIHRLTRRAAKLARDTGAASLLLCGLVVLAFAPKRQA